jgi:trehalose 6-phosphate synthase/phosphatase
MRILLVANRLPVVISRKNDQLTAAQSPGGVASGLKSFAQSLKDTKNIETLWLGWPGVGGDSAFQNDVAKKLKPLNTYPVFFPETVFKNYYEGFCNKVVWPLFHYFPEHCLNKNIFWEDYIRANELFCQRIVEQYKKGDIIFIHDYQLLLLPRMVRKALPDAQIGFFLHIPFPAYEIFRMIPTEWQKEILHGMLGANLVGFHTHEYTQYFLDGVQRILGTQNTLGVMQYGERLVKADTFPLGIDYESFAQAFNNKETQDEYKRFEKSLGTQQIILSVDRLDYSKGIINRLKAFELFLVQNPSFRRKTTLVLILVLSRTGIGDYKLMKKQIDEYIGKINGRFGDMDWTPILYQSRPLTFHKLVALYNRADAALVTPLRDGMNLVAKEYIASKVQNTGVLILSELAGAAKELGEAVIVNPFSKNEMADAIKKALTMSKKEQIRRNTVMRERLQKWSVKTWGDAFFTALEKIQAGQKDLETTILDTYEKRKILTKFQAAHRRLLLLDYDGTLVEFADHPEKSRPNESLKTLLGELAALKNTDVYIISGRDKSALEEWFGDLSVGLIAEHGAVTKDPGKESVWHKQRGLTTGWKGVFRQVITRYVERLPGSFLEEKEFALCWHYRMSDAILSENYRRELMNELIQLAANLDLQVLQGSKVIEVKSTKVNKGSSALSLSQKYDYEVIIALGDDRTDEDMFRALVKNPAATTIKVRTEPTNAQFTIKNVSAVRQFLTTLANSHTPVVSAHQTRITPRHIKVSRT